MDLISLIPYFGSFALTLAAFVVALTVIVFVHEYGHYIIGRLSGIKADVFSIGIGPRLVSRIDRHGTRWQIAALPIGGYVRFHGDANAASGTADPRVMAALGPEERRQTLHGAPLWARAATVAAGPVFNFILSIAVFAGFILLGGVASEPLKVAGLKDLPGIEGTLAPGDEILAIDGRTLGTIEAFYDLVDELPDESPLDYLVRREGVETSLSAPHPYPPLVGAVTAQSAAAEAGLEPGDFIIRVNGVPVASFAELRRNVIASEGATLALEILRDERLEQVSLTPRMADLPTPDGGFETRWLIGITGAMIFEPATETPGLGTALGYGWNQTAYIVEASLSGLYHMAIGAISSCNLSGPIGIAETSGEAAARGLASFVWFIAVLSTAVGFLNLFPIPVLDGGHLVFHAWEAISGKPPSEAVLRVLLTIGLFIVLSIMVLGVMNDLLCP